MTLGAEARDLDIRGELVNIARLPVVRLVDEMALAIAPRLPWVLWGSSSRHRTSFWNSGRALSGRAWGADDLPRQLSRGPRTCGSARSYCAHAHARQVAYARPEMD